MPGMRHTALHAARETGRSSRPRMRSGAPFAARQVRPLPASSPRTAVRAASVATQPLHGTLRPPRPTLPRGMPAHRAARPATHHSAVTMTPLATLPPPVPCTAIRTPRRIRPAAGSPDGQYPPGLRVGPFERGLRVLARAGGLLALLFAAAGSVHAQSSQCSSISDHDERYFCRALAERNASQCSSIGSQDRRSMCRALVEGRDSTCSSISGNDQRHLCRALTEGRESQCSSIQQQRPAPSVPGTRRGARQPVQLDQQQRPAPPLPRAGGTQSEPVQFDRQRRRARDVPQSCRSPLSTGASAASSGKRRCDRRFTRETSPSRRDPTHRPGHGR